MENETNVDVRPHLNLSTDPLSLRSKKAAPDTQESQWSEDPDSEADLFRASEESASEIPEDIPVKEKPKPLSQTRVGNWSMLSSAEQ